MDRDQLIENLENNGISKDGIAAILEIMDGKGWKAKTEENPGMSALATLEHAVMVEKDPILKARMAAKIISLKLEE